MKNPISLLFVAAFTTALSAQCSRWNPQTDFPPAQQMVEFLAQKDVLTREPECAAVALELLGHEHAQEHISEIVKFLTFRRKFYWEGTGFNMRPVGEIDHYPAATALFEIGKPALPALLSVVAEGPADSLKFRNAVNTIMDIHREQLPDGVRFLRRAALKETDTMRSANLNAAVAMADSFCSKESRDACVAAAQEEQDSKLEADVSRLDVLRSSNNLDAMRTQIDLDSATWQSRGRNAFLRYMYRACGELSSYDIGNSSQRALLLSQYAISVLQSGDLPLPQHVQFVEFLGFDPPVMNEAGWKDLRRQKAQFWLEAWLRVSQAIDPSFDFDDTGSFNVAPPLSTGLPAGVSPSSVKDPQLRAEYEHAIAQNHAKIERYNQQSWLKLNGPRVFKEVEQYLVNAYSRAPSDLPELQQLLSRYIQDGSVRDRVLGEVRK